MTLSVASDTRAVCMLLVKSLFHHSSRWLTHISEMIQIDNLFCYVKLHILELKFFGYWILNYISTEPINCYVYCNEWSNPMTLLRKAKPYGCNDIYGRNHTAKEEKKNGIFLRKCINTETDQAKAIDIKLLVGSK